MTTAQHLAVIERLRARAFPARRGPSDVGTSGPGYHLAELARGGGLGDDDGTRRADEADQFDAEHAALAEILTLRFGEPWYMSTWSVQVRGGEGEEIPEPWRELSGGPRFLYLWRVEDRWLAVGLAEADEERPFRLLAVVTATDPP
ncbi:hypothetical protein ACWEJP_05335 [Streptomyces sp. NPDC004749]|uniref:hypothetical protein n=1 Tax=unclassified Streptomyces TaxID=2593676 RepID=UPI0004C63CFA|nr:hypothetical protein [Streptomyces sp. NRRL F-5135]